MNIEYCGTCERRDTCSWYLDNPVFAASDDETGSIVGHCYECGITDSWGLCCYCDLKEREAIKINDKG